jgi:hypothetical protein
LVQVPVIHRDDTRDHGRHEQRHVQAVTVTASSPRTPCSRSCAVNLTVSMRPAVRCTDAALPPCACPSSGRRSHPRPAPRPRGAACSASVRRSCAAGPRASRAPTPVPGAAVPPGRTVSRSFPSCRRTGSMLRPAATD